MTLFISCRITAITCGSGESELKLDRLEGRSVFPGHFDNAIKILAGSVFTDAVHRNANANDASTHAEVAEGRQPRLKFRPVKTAGIIPFSAQIHMAWVVIAAGGRLKERIQPDNTRASASYCLEV